MIKYFFLFGAFFSISSILVACDCYGIEHLKASQLENFENADLVFVAEVVESERPMQTMENRVTKIYSYNLKVIENFKGASINTIIMGNVFSSCDIFPEEGTWLIYANTRIDGIIYVTGRGLSRSFVEPYRILYAPYITRPSPRYPEKENRSMLDVLIRLAEIQLKARKDLKAEIEYLRLNK